MVKKRTPCECGCMPAKKEKNKATKGKKKSRSIK